jgi:hypothetical protein
MACNAIATAAGITNRLFMKASWLSVQKEDVRFARFLGSTSGFLLKLRPRNLNIAVRHAR